MYGNVILLTNTEPSWSFYTLHLDQCSWVQFSVLDPFPVSAASFCKTIFCVCWWFASDLTWVLYLISLTHGCGWIQEVLRRSNDDGVSPWERGGKGVFICWEVSHGDTTTFHSPAQSAQRPHHPHPVCKLSCHSCMHPLKWKPALSLLGKESLNQSTWLSTGHNIVKLHLPLTPGINYVVIRN